MRYFLVVSYLCCAAILCGLPGTPPAGVARDANEALTADVHFRGPVSLVVSADGRRLLMGSTTGNLWATDDAGDRWHLVSGPLPPIYALRFG